MSFYKEQAFALFVLELEDLLKNEIQVVKADCLYIGDIESHLEELGKDNEDYESNGWQNDYWKSYTLHDGRILNISASGYYGGLTISLD